jgi:hypothetical protein
MSDEKKMNANMVAGAKAAEESLAREEARKTEEKLPEGHPLRQAAESRRDGGDLDGLPEGHPMRIAMEEAAERYHEQQAEESIANESEEAQEKARNVRKAKKLDRQKAQRERIAHEVEVREECQRAAKEVNKGIDDSLGSMRDLYKILADNEEVLGKNAFCSVRAMKMKRLLQAVERGLFDCRMTRV